MLPGMKKPNETRWLKEVDSISLKILSDAFTRFITNKIVYQLIKVK